MKLHRRTFIGGLASALVAPPQVFAASIVDATGRTVTAPDHVMRIYPAGPPAAVTLYTLAPDLLMGWLEPIKPEAREFLLPDVAARPQIPRLTGRGGSVNLDALTSLKPDLIVDIGNVDDTFKSLAERVQQQSGIPYVLLDGHLNRVGATYRALGQLIGRSEEAEKLASAAEKTIAIITQRSAAVPSDARPRVYYARDGSGLQTGFGGTMIAEPIEFVGARNVAAELHGAHGVATIEQIRAWNPEIIIASDADIRRQRAQRSGVGCDCSGQDRPRLSVAEAAIRLGRLSAGGQPADRAVVARQDLLSRSLSRRHQAAHPRLLHGVLSRHPDGGADRARAGGRRLNQLQQANGRVAYPQTLGVVLAGGLARRMGGGDKARIRVGGRTILERVLDRLRPQCSRTHSQRQRRCEPLRR